MKAIRKPIKQAIHLLALAAIFFLAPIVAPAQTAAPAAGESASGSANVPAAVLATIQKRVEAHFRTSFALGPDISIEVGPINDGPMNDFYEVTVKITSQGQTSAGTVYVSKDGRYMVQGAIQDLTADPLAEIRSHMQLRDYGTKGPADAKVVVVEYGDLECPVCRQFESVLRAVLPKYPQVRFVFKDFPLEQVHPWAKTASLAAHCTLKQGEDVFWKFHDAIYDNQDQVTPENAFDKLAGFAAAAGADPAAYKACLIDPATAEAVANSQEEGRSLGVTGTPTTFVDGRRLAANDPNLLQQYIDFDLSAQAGPTASGAATSSAGTAAAPTAARAR